jgi:hypothetical protein
VLTTTLERLLVPERQGRRSDETAGAGFAVPALGERPAEPEWLPIWSTNMRGGIVPVKIGKAGVARYGFTEVLPEEEDALLWALIDRLLGEGHSCADVAEAIRWMQGLGVEPCNLVLPYDWVSKACGREVTREEADEIQSTQGFISEVHGGLKVIAANVPLGLLVAHPNLAGFYTRSDDRLGLMLTRISSAWCIVTG